MMSRAIPCLVASSSSIFRVKDSESGAGLAECVGAEHGAAVGPDCSEIAALERLVKGALSDGSCALAVPAIAWVALPGPAMPGAPDASRVAAGTYKASPAARALAQAHWKL